MAERSGKLRKAARRVLAVCLTLSLAGTATASARLYTRQAHEPSAGHEQLGPGVSQASGASVYGAVSERIETTLTYTSLDAPGSGEAAVDVSWDDAWFISDDRAYNHELAQVSSVLAALAYSESAHYQARSGRPAYMENALVALGFDEVSTASYRFRSEVLDEVLNLVTDEADGVAYTIARKRLALDGCGSGSPVPRDMIVVSVRGSYGSEWLSNLDLSRDEAGDHGGYTRAAQEICNELNDWVAESIDSGAEVSVLLTGHSRGGAIANLVAAQVDDVRAGEVMPGLPRDGVPAELAQVDRVFAYTFASPATTLSVDAHSDRYDNIFNIANPSDIMPYLPLRSWGYERYGVDMELPAIDDEGFAGIRNRMLDVYEQMVGVACAADPSDKHVVDNVLADISMGIGSVEELVTPQGAMRMFASVAANVNPVRILYSHYPSTYIAWLRALSE